MADPAEIHENGVQQGCNTEAVADAGTQDDSTIPPTEAWRLLVKFPLHPYRRVFLKLLNIQLLYSALPVDAVVDTGLHLVLIKHLNDAPWRVQFESYRILCRIAIGTLGQVQKVVDAGVIPAFLEGVESTGHCDCWLGLAYIATRSVAYRDEVIQCGAIPKFVRACKASSKLNDQSVVPLSIMARMLCRYNDDQISREIQTAIIPCLLELIKRPSPAVGLYRSWIIYNVSSAFVLLCSEDDDQLVFLNSFNVVGVFVKFLEHSHTNVVFNALSVCCSFVRGSTKQAVLDHGFLGYVPRIFRSNFSRLHVCMCKVLAYILTNDESCVQAVFDAGIIPFLMKELEHEEFGVKCAAIACFAKICIGQSPLHCFQLGRWRLIPVITPLLITPLLTFQDHLFQCSVLIIIESILNITNVLELDGFLYQFMYQFQEKGGLGLLDKIRQTGTNSMRELADEIYGFYRILGPLAAA